jgi:uncharacterized membrane protein YkoI
VPIEAHRPEETIVKKKTALIVAGATAVIVLGGGGIAYAATDGFDNAFDDDRLTGKALERASTAALAEVGEGSVTDAERSDDVDHTYSVEVRLDNGGEVDVELDDKYEVVRVDGDDNAAGTAPTTPATDATTDDSALAPLTADERAEAERVVLERLGEGSITKVERSDVDVELDETFAIVEIDGVRQ